MTKTEQDKFEHARANAKAWYAIIKQLVQRLNTAEEQAQTGGDETEAVRTEIEEGPLSVMVRDGWRTPAGDNDSSAEEFEILLSTGGPALRIYGTLDQHNEPMHGASISEIAELNTHACCRRLTLRGHAMITRITKAYVRHYSDNGQTKAYVEWTGTRGEHGRTEGAFPIGAHMGALFRRAEREGVQIEHDTW